MARRAQHLRCSLSERSERADNRLDNIISSAYPSLASPVSGLLLRSTAFKIKTAFLIYALLTATDTNTSPCIASFFLWCHFTGVVLFCAFPLRTVRLYPLYPGLYYICPVVIRYLLNVKTKKLETHLTI